MDTRQSHQLFDAWLIIPAQVCLTAATAIRESSQGTFQNGNSVKPNILFIHSVCPAQFSDLCEHLNHSGQANAWYLTTPGNKGRNKHRYQNLLAFQPDGNMMAASKYYYTGKVERAARISLGLHRCLSQIIDELGINLIVAHGSWGSPHLLFDEVDVPIITYIEFPSYAGTASG